MAIKDTIDNVIQKFGTPATLRTYTTTTNEYGEVIEDAYTEKFIYVIFFNNIKNSYLRQILGIIPTDNQEFLVSADETVDENSIVVVDGKEYHIKMVEKIYYKGTVVAQVLSCS